jgi:hypothetical protein
LGFLPANHVTVAKVAPSSYPSDSIEGELLPAEVDWDHVQLDKGSKADRLAQMTELMAAKAMEKRPYSRTMAKNWFGATSKSPDPVINGIRRVEAALIAGGLLSAPPEEQPEAKGAVYRLRHGFLPTVHPNSEAISDAVPQIVSWIEQLTGPTLSELRPHVVKETRLAANDAFATHYNL